MSVRVAVCLLLLAVSVAAPAAGQQAGAVATIRGRVIDPQRRGVEGQGAVVQTSTGLTRETRSDASGHFAIASIPPGDVDLIVSAQGFAERRIGASGSKSDRPLKSKSRCSSAAVEEKVTVAGDAGTVDVLGSVVGSVISAREIESLPLNGRNFLELAFLTPGSAPAPNFDPDQGAVGHRLVRRPGRPRRQHHHRRHGRQRRCGGRAAAEHLRRMPSRNFR